MKKIQLIAKFITDHAPAILTGFAAAGTITTTALAVKSTPKALDELDRAYLDKGESLTKKEVVLATWKCYIPTAVSGTMTLACILAANYTHIQKETAAAAMATFFEQRYIDYQNKVVEEYGEEASVDIERKVAKDHMEANPPRINRDLKKGEFLCYEPMTDQYFLTTDKELMWAELTANKILQMEERVTLNQILSLFPTANHKMRIGEKLGWWLDESYYEFIGYNWGFYGRPWLDMQPSYETIDGQQVLILRFSVAPVREEAYDVEEMMDTRARAENELSFEHIKEEVAQAKKKSQEKQAL